MRLYLLFLFLTTIFFSFSPQVQAQYVTIPDANFAAYLNAKFPSCMQGNKMDTTCTEITTTTQLYISDRSIEDLTGVQYFDQLFKLSCYNNKISFLPPLPSTLIDLACDGNNLTSLPALPASLHYFTCSANALTVLPTLPPSLEWLLCESNNLVTLPFLPNSLVIIDCSENQLTSLPVLPQSLQELMCWKNKLTALPSLPPALSFLRCEYNQLTELPPLPASIRFINASENLLTQLPLLPQGLEDLHCDENQLQQMPALPTSLLSLNCSMNYLSSLPYLPVNLKSLVCENNQIASLPYLPEGLMTMACRHNQITCLPILPNTLINLVTDTLCRPNMPTSLNWNVPSNAASCSALTFTHTRVCAGDSTVFTMQGVNCHAFLWDFDDPVTGANNTSTLQNPKHLFSKPGTFHVKLISYVSDPATVITKTVIVDKLPRIDLGDDHSICPDDGIVLDAGIGFETYLWQDGSPAQTYAVKTAGTYTVTATNACGAVADGIQLRDYTLTIPNLFTPNKDGLNDTFEIKGTDGNYGALQVFNSWGGQIFGAERYYNNWGGEEMLAGIYYYSFTFKSCPVQKGWVQIIR
jgi:gliding motility-associated-like protein